MNSAPQVMLIILDGWGHGQPSDSNAVFLANTPNMDRWQRDYPFTTLVAHNGAVGLPEGQMGNSEVGHLNIGAGRVVYQDFTRISKAIADGDFFNNPVLLTTIDHTVRTGKALHLLGLVSDGGVHSHLDHLAALIRLAAGRGLNKIFIHAFMDGRDTPPKSGAGHIGTLQQVLAAAGAGRIATISGRYYAMDRDNRWDRVQQAWQAMVDGRGIAAADPSVAIAGAYDRGETDEFIRPIILQDDSGLPAGPIMDGDSMIFFNFRADRVRELVHAFTDQTFDKFPSPRRPQLATCVTFTEYDRHFDLPIAFPPVSLTRILGEEVSRHGLKQLRIAETEKYAHVTYFFNGGREDPFPLEDRVLLPSPKEVATYDQKPEMSAIEVTDALLARLDRETYSLIVVNFANGDMVGHSGILAAAIRACETVDSCLGRLAAKFVANGGIMMITADHGNAESMFDSLTNGPMTAHTLNPVPFLLVSDRYLGRSLRHDGALKDIAPTILTLMQLPVPEEMKGECLLVGACG